MRKSLKALFAAFVFALAVPASVSAFEWSECWCNYGGGIENHDFIINVDGGIWFSEFAYTNFKDFWFIPPVMVDVQFAQPIWKLPFTFGGYAGFRSYGYSYIDRHEWIDGKYTPVYASTAFMGMFVGGEAAYHIQLPPEQLDVYAVSRVGATIPFMTPHHWDAFECFNAGGAIGANWFFNKNFGLNLECGYPMTKFGLTLKF